MSHFCDAVMLSELGSLRQEERLLLLDLCLAGPKSRDITLLPGKKRESEELIDVPLNYCAREKSNEK